MNLIKGDCFAELELFKDESLDAIVTDPPYMMSQIYGSYAAAEYGPNFTDFLNSSKFYSYLLSKAKPKLKEDAYLAIFANWKTLLLLQKAAIENNLRITSVIVWDKDMPGIGPFDAVRNSYELIVLIAKGKPKIKDRKFRNIYQFKFAPTHRKTAHPAEKPVEVLKDIIKLLLPKGGIVCDPFMGSGTTGVACYELGVEYKFMGIEQEERYFNIAKERLENGNNSNIAN